MNYGKLNPQTLKDFGNKKWSGKLNGFVLTQLKYLTKKSELLDDDRCYTQPQKQLSSWRLVDIMVPIIVWRDFVDFSGLENNTIIKFIFK